MPMKILVTGANGFVGRALCAALAQAGHTVLPVCRRGAAAALPGLPPYLIDQLDATTPWAPAVFQGVDAVVHLAARVHAMGEDASAAPLYQAVNVQGSLRLAQACVQHGVRRLVFVSTAKVMGEGHPDGAAPYTLQDAPQPQGAYAQSKWQAEQVLRALAAGTGLELVVLRPPLVYGPGVKGNVAALLRWVQRGWPLPLGGVTHNRRTLVALDNLVHMIQTCLLHPAAANQTLFVGDAQDLSTAELLRAMAAAAGRPNRAVALPPVLLRWGAGVLGQQAVYQRVCGSFQLDTSHTRALLGWQPVVGPEQALRQMVQQGAGQ